VDAEVARLGLIATTNIVSLDKRLGSADLPEWYSNLLVQPEQLTLKLLTFAATLAEFNLAFLELLG
jgi:hypothetical protein